MDEENYKIRGLQSSQNILGIIKSKKMRSIPHVARTTGMRNACRYKILSRVPEEEGTLERTRRGWVEILKSILNKLGITGWSEFKRL
jgi:hypothetical protein